MWSRLSTVTGIAAALVIAAVLPAAASGTATNGEITLTAGGSTTMTYGESSPTFRSVLTLPSGDPPPTDMTFYFLVDSQMDVGSVSWSNPTWTLFENGFGPPPLSVGQHAVVAQYKSPSHVLTSAPVILNVLKKTPGLDCSINNVTNTYATNTPLTITVGFSNTNAPVDIQNGTFSITFTGPRTFTSANLRANSAGQVFASIPSARGIYQTRCAFSGTASFNSVATQMNMPTVVVSANNQPGRIALYTNPTPVTHGPNITWRVVVSARPGLPTPTGNVSVDIGRSYTKLMALGSGGIVTFQAVAPSQESLASIRVWYYGDPVYASAGADFPPTTPPIPGDPATSADTAAQRSSRPSAGTVSATPGASESPVPSAVSIALPSPSNRLGAALVGSAGRPVPDGRPALAAGAIALLTLVGLGAGLAWRRRQRRRS
jgi:hypothetical protein